MFDTSHIVYVASKLEINIFTPVEAMMSVLFLYFCIQRLKASILGR